MTDLLSLAGACAAAAVASGVNAIAGGGMLIAYPIVLALGLPPINANATSSAGLFIGSLAGVRGYSIHMEDSRPLAKQIMVVSATGGTLGAIILTRTSNATFAAIIPWLILGATLVFALPLPGGATRSLVQGRVADTLSPLALVALFVVAIYGGFFGAGAGFAVLAMLHMLGLRNVHQMNGLKLLVGVSMNAAAIAVFTVKGLIDWRVGIAMMIGAGVGGRLVTAMAQRIPQRAVRAMVIVCGFGAAVWLFQR
jgi:uncharacterized membrane protein YfcA